MTRGNHETRAMNSIYGFEGEVRAKYNDTMAKLFAEVFRCLPLGAVLGEKVFVVHGGLFSRDDVTLDELRTLDRFREPPDEGPMCEVRPVCVVLACWRTDAAVADAVERPAAGAGPCAKQARRRGGVRRRCDQELFAAEQPAAGGSQPRGEGRRLYGGARRLLHHHLFRAQLLCVSRYGYRMLSCAPRCGADVTLTRHPFCKPQVIAWGTSACRVCAQLRWYAADVSHATISLAQGRVHPLRVRHGAALHLF